MPKQIIGGTFETLGQAAQQAGQQVGQQVGPGKILEQAAQQVGLKPTETGTEQPQQTSGSVKAQPGGKIDAAKVAQRKAQAFQRVKQLEEEVKQIGEQRKKEEEETRQVTVQPPVEAGRKITQLAEEKEKPLPPPPVAMAQRSAGAERRIKGASG